ncbi:MAG: methylated-DNA--[protein]-cysteine S-methyltransferase [Luminiphilus sp.]|nr:methylated-DNA--[protein]-cysteine S-methyltransferase [Luminiphilus sp.]
MRCLDTLDTPLGTLQIEATARGLCGIWFPSRSVNHPPSSGKNRVITLAKQELSAYFTGDLTTFSVPLDWQGTRFQESVWQALLAVPFGKTVTYGDVARAIGRPRSSRPVGGAVGRNPLPIIVPCHRVIGSDRSLTGFTGGLDIKIRLLELEGHSIN